jgi:hypothetical protein
VKNENDIRKDNPSIFLQIITLFKLFGQKHDSSMFVSFKNFIIQYFNERRVEGGNKK